MFSLLGRLAVQHPWKICAVWLLLGLLLLAVAPSWDHRAQDDDIHFLPGRCPSVRGYQLLAEAFPQDVFASRLIFAVERPDRPLTAADFALVDRLTAELTRLRQEEPGLQIGNVVSHRDGLIGRRLVSADRHCTLIQVALATPFLALQTRQTVDRAEAVVRRRLAEAGPGLPHVLTTGPAGVGRDLTRAGADRLDGTTLATVALVIVVLLFVYRAPLLALVPLVTIAVSVWIALHLMALMTLLPGVHLVNVSKVFAIVILYGAGTDYCLFLVSRYREELEGGANPPAALRLSVAAVGGSLAASAGTVVCGLGLMGFAEFAKVRCAGPAIAVSLGIALAASLTLTPALLHLLGRVAFWPVGVRAPADILRFRREPSARSERFWDWVSRGVVARPVLVWTACVLALLPLTVLGLRVAPNYQATGELHPRADSVQGLAAIQKHFPAGEAGPLTVLLESQADWNTPEGRDLIAHLSRGFRRLDNVVEVRSLTQPLGTEVAADVGGKGLLGGLLRSARRDFLGGVLERAERSAREFYLAGVPGESGTRHVTRLDVVLCSDPFAPASRATLELIQLWLANELPRSARGFGAVRAECYGVTVNARDLAEVTEADRVRVNGLVLAGILGILLVLVRRPWLAAYLLATVLFSYYATLGASALAATLWAGRPLGLVDWRVPFFLFVILVAVGQDYNILLVMRVLQERVRHGTAEGARRALARTGGTITSCGLIMAGTFATLMLSGLGTLVQIGFALAFGILLDTFVVRPFLVPAFLLLVWKERGAPRVPCRLPGAGPRLRRAA
jgi:putative drug exporter of the RND superfamily